MGGAFRWDAAMLCVIVSTDLTAASSLARLGSRPGAGSPRVLAGREMDCCRRGALSWEEGAG